MLGPTLLVALDADDSLIGVFPNPMLSLKDGDPLIDFGPNQCQVHMEDESLPFLEPQHYRVIRAEIKLETVKDGGG